jgi:hypothetical protein
MGDMEHWKIEMQNYQHILTHFCEKALPSDGASIIRQDIGGGYVRCERCGEKYLPESSPGGPRLMFRVEKAEDAGANSR